MLGVSLGIINKHIFKHMKNRNVNWNKVELERQELERQMVVQQQIKNKQLKLDMTRLVDKLKRHGIPCQIVRTNEQLIIELGWFAPNHLLQKTLDKVIGRIRWKSEITICGRRIGNHTINDFEKILGGARIYK